MFTGEEIAIFVRSQAAVGSGDAMQLAPPTVTLDHSQKMFLR